MTHDMFGEVRAICQSPLTAQSWEALCALLERWPDPEQLRHHVIPYLTHHLKDVPRPCAGAGLMSAPHRWGALLRAGADATCLLAARAITVDLSWLDAQAGWTPQAELISHATCLTLSNTRDLAQWLPVLDFEVFRKLEMLDLGVGGTLPPRAVELLASKPGLESLRALYAYGLGLDNERLASLSRAPWFKDLSALSLEYNHLTPHEGGFLGALSGMTQLEELNIGSNDLSEDSIAQLCALDLPSLRSLSLSDARLTEQDFCTLPAHPLARGLSLLDVCATDLGDRAICALAASPFMRALTTLRLSHTRLGAEGMQALSSSPTLTGLTALELDGHTTFSSESWGALLAHQGLEELSILGLNSCGLSDEALTTILSNFAPRALGSLSLCHNRLGAPGLGKLLSHESTSALDYLGLHNNPLADDGIQELLKAPCLASLTELNLQATRLTDDSLERLAASLPAGNLTRLNLSKNELSDRGLRHLLAWQGLPHLTSLTLGDQSISPQVLRLLLEAMPALSSLSLRRVPLGEAHMSALLAPALPALRILSLPSCQLNDACAQMLAGSEMLAHLSHVSLGGNEVTRHGRGLIEQAPHASPALRVI